MSYDSTADTLKHIKRVNHFMVAFAVEILRRAQIHDESKLHPPEKEYFDIGTPKLAGLTYGSDEYRAALKEIKPGIEHHHAKNSHHPEHYQAGVNDMSLFDIVEMFCDWKAATERHNDGNLNKSIDHNRDRFEMAAQLCAIFKNTIRWTEEVK